MTKQSVIAIDGPSGSGKSTVAKLVSEKLGYMYIDTGAMFRAVALGVLQQGKDPAVESEVNEVIDKINFSYNGKKDDLISVNGLNVTEEIRKHHVSEAASKVSQFPIVRDLLKKYQRHLVAHNICVMEGRDIGTVVFPEAKLKVFLTASNKQRAKRRYLDLEKRGTLGELTLDNILDDIIKRDERDSSRDVAPLVPAIDSTRIDSDKLSVDEVVSMITKLAKEVF